MLGIPGILCFVNVLPGILRERHVRACLRGVRSGNARFDRQVVPVLASDEHAANLRLAAGPCVLPDLPDDFAIDGYSRLWPVRG
jgi:hypothetical protein